MMHPDSYRLRIASPARFVEQARAAAAAQLLLRTQWPQEKIATRSGLRSVDALQRAFARHYGLTPRAYREGIPPTAGRAGGDIHTSPSGC